MVTYSAFGRAGFNVNSETTTTRRSAAEDDVPENDDAELTAALPSAAERSPIVVCRRVGIE
ncbi:hypothetical protein [Halorubrum sp. Boch-26]|uniref:hypothetical protein n=1 Tax=Halorubrum sp. Boch-26 TaxID=2994426 RepID=UPI0024695B86|nr:hypothetical protein [Halorubrum sp. Boch-26]